MISKIQRRERYDKLTKKYGLLQFEAYELSKIPLNIPYFRDFLLQRRRKLLDMLSQGKTRKDYEAWIYGEYSRGRLFKAGLRYEKCDPWKMLRAFEDNHKQKHPDYESPWVKKARRKTHAGFLARLSKTRARIEQRNPNSRFAEA